MIYVAKIVINFATLPVFCSMRLADASHRESASRFEPICGRKSKKFVTWRLYIETHDKTYVSLDICHSPCGKLILSLPHAKQRYIAYFTLFVAVLHFYFSQFWEKRGKYVKTKRLKQNMQHCHTSALQAHLQGAPSAAWSVHQRSASWVLLLPPFFLV